MTSFEEVWLPDNDSIVVIVPTSDGGFYTSDGRFYRNDFVTDDWLRRLKTAEARQYHLEELAIKAGKPLSQAKNYQKQVRKVSRMYADLEHHR